MKNDDGLLPKVVIDLEHQRLIVRSPLLGRLTLNFGQLFSVLKGERNGTKENSENGADAPGQFGPDRR